MAAKAKDAGVDLVCWGKSYDAVAGMVANAIALGEERYSGNGVFGSTNTQLFPNAPGVITALAGISEDGALSEYRVRRTSDKDYIRTTQFHKGQTERGDLNTDTLRCHYPIKMGDKITCDITNAAAKMDAIGMLIGKNGVIPSLSSEPIVPIPKDAIWAKGTATVTYIADSWKTAPVTFTNYNLERDKLYRCLAWVMDGATLMFGRFRPVTGLGVDSAQGWIGGDTDQINVPCYTSHPFEFAGLTGLNFEGLCFAADAVANISLLIEEI